MHVYCAGCDTPPNFKWAQSTPGFMRRAMFSAMHSMEKATAGESMLRWSKQAVQSVMIDSGAHSFFAATPGIKSAVGHKSKSVLPPPDVYFEKYLAWLLKMSGTYDWFVELDIGKIVGYAKVLEWRKAIDKAGLLDKCLIVAHHQDEPYPKFFERAKRHPSRYIGLEGHKRTPVLSEYFKLLQQCLKSGIRSHGFAMTGASVFRFPYYSVDSSTWLSGSKYGMAIMPSGVGFGYTQKQVKEYTTDDTKRGEIIDLILRSGVKASDFVGHSRASVLERNKAGAKAMSDLEDQATRYWKDRGVDWSQHGY